jgi:hypothetical protein
MGATPTNDAGSGPTKGGAPQASTTNAQGSTSNDQNATNSPPSMHLSQRLRDDLGRAGFTDIRIMPESLLVRAKDSQGNPVVMEISPDSVASVTEQNPWSNATRKDEAGANNEAHSPAAKP